MPGTLLASDWQSSVEDELHRHVTDAINAATQAAQNAAGAIPQIQAPQISVPTVNPQAVLDELNQHVQNIVQTATQVAQPAVVQLGQVQNELQNHVATVLGGAAQGPFTPLNQPQPQQPTSALGQPTITTLGGGSTDATAPLGAPAAAGGDVLGAPSADTTASTTAVQTPQSLGAAGRIPANYNVPIDKGPTISRAQAEAVVKGTPLEGIGGQIWDLGVKYNVDPAFALSVAKNESAYGDPNVAPSQNRTNNIWDISNALYGGTPVPGTRWGQYPDKITGAEAFYKLITQEYYPKGQTSVGSVMWGPDGSQTHAYAPLSENSADYPQRLIDTMGNYRQLPGGTGGQPSTAPTAPVTTAQARAADLGYRDISQFGDQQLTPAEAYAACGPAAAVRFAERFGRQPTLREATDLAASVGWTAQSGMAGISSEQSLMNKLGIKTKLIEGPQWDVFAREAQTGNPVTISTYGKNGGHYFFADAFNPDTGAFHVGQSGKDLIGGSEWMTPAQMQNLMGSAQGALFADQPVTPVPSTAVAGGPAPTLGATTGTAAAPINVPGPQAKPPIVMGQNQPVTQIGGDQQQGLTPIQTAGDAVAGVVGDIKRAGQQAVATLGGELQNQVGGTASQLGTGVQSGISQVQSTVGGAADQLGTAVQQNVVQPAQAVAAAVAPNLGGDDAELARRRAALDQPGSPTLGGVGGELATGQPGEQTPGSVVGGLLGATGGTVQSPAEIRRNVEEVSQGLQANNPIRDVVVAGGLSNMVIDQVVQNPLLFVPGAPMGASLTRVGEQIVGDVAPNVAPVLGRLGAAALNGGVQNAIYEMGRADATPQSVGEAFATGAGLGAGLDIAPTAILGIGKAVLKRVPDIADAVGPAVGQFIRSEQGATRIPGQGPQQDVLHGMAVPRTGYEPGTPEHTTETFLQDQARAQNTPNPQLSAADIGGLPGMAGSRMRGLQEVRDAVDAGLPAARWYQEMVQQVRKDTGEDINPREAAVLMGAFGGNAGVAPNYHAMLSVFDAMRQARPDLTGFENMTEPQIQATQAFKDVAALVHGDKSYADDSMLARVMRGYRTGEIPVPSGAKLSSYTQDFLHALNEQYVPYSTQDVWQGRLFGARPDVQGGNGLPNVSQSDAAYRTMHALTNWVARERNLPPEQAQAAGWTVFRTLWTDPVIGPELRNDRVSLSDAIRQGQQAGLLDPRTMAAGGLAEVTAPRTAVPTSWASKINDVRERIQNNGSYNAPPPETATAVNEMALYHPSIQSAAQQRSILDPSGFQYGTVAGPKVGVRRPVGTEPAATLRDLALGDQPVLRVRGELQVDPTTGKIPWLLPEHAVQQTAGHAYVTVAGVGDDAAHLIGQRLGADRFNHADPTSTNTGGLAIELGSRADQARISDALNAAGLPVLREQGGTGIRVPLLEGRPAALARSLQQVLSDEGVAGTIGYYTGDTHAVESPGSSRVGRARDQASPSEPLGVPPGDRLSVSLFRDAREAAYGAPGFVAPGGRQRGELGQLPFGINVGGAVAGGYAGNLATPQEAPPEERLRNIGLGATAGLLGTRAITAALERNRLAPEVARAATEGFRAPEVGARPGENLLRAATEEPTNVPGVTRRTETVGGEAPVNIPEAQAGARTLSDVRSNPHLLAEARPGEAPMTDDELMAHYDQLDTQRQQVEDRLAAIDEQLRNPTQKPERPPWGAGWTNDQLVTLAKRQGLSAYEPLWWEKAGLLSGSGEVREDVGQSGLARGMGRGGAEPTPTELRAERAQLVREQTNIQEAGDQLANATPGQRFVRREQATTADLPFAQAEGPLGAGGGRDEGARTAQEIVTNKGRLTSDEAQLTGEAGGVTGRGIVNPTEAVPEAPSADTVRRMPNMDALLGRDMPEVAAQIQKSAEDNPALWDAYRQGTITFDSLKNDLAARVGMSKEDWLKTKVGQAFNERELVALQAAMVESQNRQTALAREVIARGGVDALTPEELAYSLSSLVDAQRLAAVARGGRATAGRALNALKIRMDEALASSITAANTRKAAQRVVAQAKRAAARADELLPKATELEREKARATAAASRPERPGAPRTPRSIIDQIAQAYDELDRYNALSLHEKATVFDRLQEQRAANQAKRRAAVRGAPEELLSALQAELRWEQNNFAKRKNTWETMAFMDSKAGENAARERAAFRGGLYIEQQRRVARLAADKAQKDATAAFDAEARRRGQQSAKAQRLLEGMGGVEVNKKLLGEFVAAINDPDPMVAAKFLQGTSNMSWWKRAGVIRIAGLLSSPITHMVNMGGNVSGAIVEVPTRALVVGIDALRAAATGGERQAYAGELWPMMKAYGPGFLGALPEAVRTLKTGITSEQAADLSRIHGRFSPNEGVNLAVEAPLRALQAEDVLFRQGAYSAHSMRVATRQAIREGYQGAQVQGRAATILKNLQDYPELAQEAADAAARQVFQERRTVPGLSRVPEPNEAAQFAYQQVLPFVRTPANITAQGAGMSPLGLLGVAQAAGKARGLPTGSASERAVRGREVLLAEERLARTVIGTGILGAGIALGSAGMLTAAYPTDPTEASTLPQGWRPWSMRLHDPVTDNTYYVPLQNMGPPGFAMAMAAILTDPKHRNKTVLDPSEQVNAATAIGRYVIDNTFLQGVSDMVDALHDPKTGASKFAEPLAASYGPYSSLAREAQRMMGVASRNPHDGLVGLIEAFEANYPGLSGNVPEATTPLGEPRTQGATGIGRYIPARYDIERDEPTLQALRSAGVGIPPAPKAINVGNGWSIQLSEAEQDQLKRARGVLIRDQVASVLASPRYQRAVASGDISFQNQLMAQAVSNAAQNSNVDFERTMTKAQLQARAERKAAPEPYILGSAAD